MPGTKQLGQSRKGLKNLPLKAEMKPVLLDSAAVALSPGQGPAEANPQALQLHQLLGKGI